MKRSGEKRRVFSPCLPIHAESELGLEKIDRHRLYSVRNDTHATFHSFTMRAALTLLALAAASTVQALPRITRQGRYLVDPTGARFFIKGIAYQPAGNGELLSCSVRRARGLRNVVQSRKKQRPTLLSVAFQRCAGQSKLFCVSLTCEQPSDYVDPLADITTCTRDLPNLQTVRFLARAHRLSAD